MKIRTRWLGLLIATAMAGGLFATAVQSAPMARCSKAQLSTVVDTNESSTSGAKLNGGSAGLVVRYDSSGTKTNILVSGIGSTAGPSCPELEYSMTVLNHSTGLSEGRVAIFGNATLDVPIIPENRPLYLPASAGWVLSDGSECVDYRVEVKNSAGTVLDSHPDGGGVDSFCLGSGGGTVWK